VLLFNTYDGKSPKFIISVMALLDRNYVWQSTVSRGRVVVEKSISTAPFYRLFSPHIFPQISLNVCKKCWFSLFLQNKLMTHNSMHIETNNSKDFRQEQTSLPLSSVMMSKRKCVCLTFLLSVLVCTDAILIVSAHQSAYKAENLTQSITNSIWF